MIVLLAQASLSFSNDYFDAEADRFTVPGVFSGGSGVLVRHPELKPMALRIAVTLSVGSILVGIVTWITYRYPLELLAFVALGNVLA
jgi:1,4-dihydroxy-2-naphthoate octaprenyltransferase